MCIDYIHWKKYPSTIARALPAASETLIETQPGARLLRMPSLMQSESVSTGPEPRAHHRRLRNPAPLPPHGTCRRCAAARRRAARAAAHWAGRLRRGGVDRAEWRGGRQWGGLIMPS
jgi:hypothetical protein